MGTSAEDPLTSDAALDLLGRGTLEVQGRIVGASNATLLATVTLAESTRLCVYKPVAGEQPLWDFPGGTLARREVAAYLLSEATGWDVVPPTVLRLDAPFGPGSVQLWVDTPDDEPGGGMVDVVPRDAVPDGWLGVVQAYGVDGEPVTLVHLDDPRLRRMAVLDAVANNADRKGGHVLVTADGAVHGVDHGLTFNTIDKLRTVLWGWGGRRLPPDALEVLQALSQALDPEAGHGLGAALADLLDRAEVRRTRERVDRLLRTRRLPRPEPGRPSIPWPPF
jgi:uncharacterized repeat protein (TIGR03843 family)